MDPQDLLDQLDNKEIKAFRDHKEVLVQLEGLDLLGLLDQLVLQDHLVPQVGLVQLDQKDL